MANTDYYEVLGLTKEATQDDIKSSYRELSKKYHPDVNDAANANLVFRMVEEAYSILSKPAKREEYDNRYSGGFKERYQQYDEDIDEKYEEKWKDFSQRQEKIKSSSGVGMTILTVVLKILALPLLLIVSFLHAVVIFLGTILTLVCWLLFGLFMIGIIIIFFTEGAFNAAMLGGIIGAFVAFVAAMLAQFLPVITGVAKEFLKGFIFGFDF